MQKNMSSADSIARLVVAAAAVAIAVWAGLGSVVGIVALAVAIVMAVTAVTGFCPLYRLFGTTTRRPRAH
ncbi:hypothetical protein GCM10027425_28610 [Alteromonas gracilis]